MSIHEIFIQQFYKKSTWIYFLIPISFLFLLIIYLRKLFYSLNIFKVYKLKVPVVIVGNITLGGTGKTPLIIFLAKELLKRKLKVGIISKGYKSNKRYSREVTKESTAINVGDEPLLIKKYW